MSKSVNSQSNPPVSSTAARASRLERWLAATLVQQDWQVQYRIRGNTLHLLCRKTPCPARRDLLLWLIPILQKTDFTKLRSAELPPIYQIWLYGCEVQSRSPQWTAKLYLNQLDHHLQDLQDLQVQDAELVAAAFQETPRTAPSSRTVPDRSALTLSNQALAKRGEEMAIACYLSETLSELGVAVRVNARVIPYQPPATVQSPEMALPFTTQRLWIACEAAYSPDPSLVAEPITQKLRQLEVEGFHDAVIRFQVAGESRPDWVLRVDLTPPTEMLREWARWGDLEAIQRLLNRDIAELQLQVVTATLNATTLHLCCASLLSHTSAPVMAAHKRAKADIALLLEAIAPQGIHAATLYGQISEQEAPAWIEWLDLPATQHPAFAEPAIELARQGDWGAIAFSLHRLLNPNLDEYLATGGIRLQLLPKRDLLHVMCEASHCPDRRQVVPIVVRFLKQLNLAEVTGVRLYGRRSGQKTPLWSDGSDFVKRSRLVPEAAPEFAVSDMDVAELLSPPDQTALRPDLTPADLQQVWQRWQQQTIQTLRQVCLRSQLFALPVTTQPALPGESPTAGRKGVLIWGAVGLLLMLQANWLLGAVREPSPLPAVAQAPDAAVPSPAGQDAAQGVSSTVKLPQAPQPQTDSVFNASGFTRSIDGDPPPVEDAATVNKPSKLPYVPRSQTATLLTAEIISEHADWPSFNSQQLDQKLQLYYRFVEKHGAPDVLIVGSSRALRGVDPIALQAALADLGYADDRIFNLGINGATAQVVDLLLRQLLTAEQLPRLVLWADGARAFNSGTVDVTYNGIVASAAYQQLLAGTLPIPSLDAAETPAPLPTFNRTLQDSYALIDRQLSQKLAQVSGRDTDRDRLKQWIQRSLTGFLPQTDPATDGTVAPVLSAQSGDRVSEILQSGQALPDETGFLSLASQFNPATYYQKYARVLGAYDSDYENFRIGGDQAEALQSLAKFSRSQNIPIVFVNLPLTEDYLDPVRLEYEQTFRDYMVQFSLQNPGFAFRDLGEQWTTQYDYFSDPSHLNRYGAYAVSKKLAQDAKIPWLRSTTEVSNQTTNPAIEDES